MIEEDDTNLNATHIARVLCGIEFVAKTDFMIIANQPKIKSFSFHLKEEEKKTDKEKA